MVYVSLLFRTAWNKLEIKYQKKYSLNYIRSLKSSYRKYILTMNINKWSEFGNKTNVELFVEKLRAINTKDHTIKTNIFALSLILTSIMKEQSNGDRYAIQYNFKSNVFEDYLNNDDTYFKNDVENHKTITFDAISTWIKTIEESNYRTMFIFYSLGLRLSEPLRLKKEQFDFENKYILNVKRKGKHGGKIHKKFGLPDWSIPYIKEYVENSNNPDNKIFKLFWGSNIGRFSEKHYNNLIQLKQRLEAKESLNTHWQQILKGIKDLEKNGKYPTPHQFRTSWDTQAQRMGMRDTYRWYHMSHSLSGMDQVYIKIAQDEENYKEYLTELNTKSPKYL